MIEKEPQIVHRDRESRIQHRDGYKKQTRITEHPNAERRVAVAKAAQFIWLLVVALEALIGLRVVLKLIAANPANPIATMVYALSDFFLWPFWGLTVTPSAQGMVLEIPSLIAMFLYALLGWLIVRLVWVVFYRPSTGTIHTVEREEQHQHELD